MGCTVTQQILLEPEAIRTRHETPDSRAIRDLNRAAFSDDDEGELVDDLREHECLLHSFVAELVGVIVGHLAFSPLTIETSEDLLDSESLGPMVVPPNSARRRASEVAGSHPSDARTIRLR